MEPINCTTTLSTFTISIIMITDMINTNSTGISTTTPLTQWNHTLMDRVHPQALHLSPNMFIIKHQPTPVHIIPTMTQATIMIHIITLRAIITGQAMAHIPQIGQANHILGRAPITRDGQANHILGRAPITRDGQANHILGRAPITQDGQANLILGRAPITQDGQARIITGRALISQRIGQIHNRTIIAHTILHGQASLIIGKVLIIQENGLAHSITTRAHTTQDGQANLIIGQADITFHKKFQAHTKTANHHG
jgi:hypothetical protein